jgi:hypothetical protein
LSSLLKTRLSFLKVKGLHSAVKSEGVYNDDLLGLQKEVSPITVLVMLVTLFVRHKIVLILKL